MARPFNAGQERPTGGDLSRRNVLRGAGAIAGGAVLGPTVLTTSAALEDVGVAAEAAATATLTEGTNIGVALAPGGERLAFDAVTSIWTVPVGGGTATRLTDDLTDATRPHWSPDGRTLVFQAYRTGNFHLWTIGADGSGLRRLTDGPFDHREPRFAPDGRSVVFASDRGETGSYGIFTLELATGKITARTDSPSEEAMPTWSPDGARIAFTVDETAIDVLDVASGEITRRIEAPKNTKLFAPSFAPDGRTIAYIRQHTLAIGLPVTLGSELVVGDRVITGDNEDVFPLPAAWLSRDELLYTADGRIKRRGVAGGVPAEVSFAAVVPVRAARSYRQAVRDVTSPGERAAQGIASPVASRDGRRFAFRALGALWLADVGDPKPRRLVADGYFNSDPDFAPDGRSIVYSSDRAGDADLWVRELDGGTDRRLSGLDGAQLMPRYSPDGKRIAYADQDGAIWVLEIANGKAKQVTPELFMPGRPTWSADGNTLALAAVKPYSKRFREGTSQILTVDLPSGEITYTEPMRHASISTRGDDGPTWSPDGKHLVFVVDSVAWVVPVDATGKFTGEPRAVTDEVTDAPSWLGPDRLLYLNNGRLRAVSISGGEPADVPLSLNWRPAKVRERSVIRVGALWDGREKQLRRNVDVVVERGRITEVLPSSDGRTPTVDARDLTVLPGLIEAHNHWHLRGRQWGDRQGRLWLSYGVTTTRSPGDPAYQFAETREALESGSTVGPRLYGTGEAIDGSRIYYGFMRPTRSAEQLELELERARELSYDMVKTYVRLPVEYQQRAIEAAHQAGMPVSSHYLYPAANLGSDGMEHTGSTNRLGYSQTVSKLGRGYADAVELFARSGMSLTPTLFFANAMFTQDDSLVKDRRTTTLYPTWEYEQLMKRAGLPPDNPLWQPLGAHVDMVLRVHRAGGLVIAGTDAPLDSPALALHNNLRAMVRFGFQPYEALCTATGNTARWLGMPDELGVVAPGAYADLTFVKGDPLADIRAAADVRMTMVGGVLHTVDELLAPFTAPSGRAAPAAVREAEPAAHRHDEPWWHTAERTQRVCCGV